MGGYIVRYRGKGTMPPADLAAIRGQPGVTVVDESGRMLLIRSSRETAEELAKLLPGWLVAPEQQVPLPDTRMRISNEAE